MNEKEEPMAETVRESAIANWMAVFGTPGIMVARQDSRFVGGIFRTFAMRVT